MSVHAQRIVGGEVLNFIIPLHSHGLGSARSPGMVAVPRSGVFDPLGTLQVTVS
jgi:hypothetical protein